MKNKLLLLSCAVSVLSSAAALAAVLSARARADESAPGAGGLTVVAEDAETRVYSFQSAGHLCFLASTRGGAGLSLQCPR